MQEPVTGETLARWFGVSSRTVTQLAARGIAIRKGRGRFDLEASVHAYAEHLRGLAHGRKEGDGPGAGRARLAKAQEADAIELKMAVQRGALLDAGEVEREWSGVCRTIRAGIMRIPRRAGNRLGLGPDAVQVLDDEVREVLTELGTG